MTIHPHQIEHLERLAPGYRSPMLMLGRQGSTIEGFPTAREYFRQWVDVYQDLDLDGGDLHLDLNRDSGLDQDYETVFNLGTIEHCWDAHNAWANALRAVTVGGTFISVCPINGWVGHGIHLTHPDAIVAFIAKNGFTIIDCWTTRWKQQGEVMWLRAEKERHIEWLADFEPAWQVYEEGKKKGVE